MLLNDVEQPYIGVIGAFIEGYELVPKILLEDEEFSDVQLYLFYHMRVQLDTKRCMHCLTIKFGICFVFLRFCYSLVKKKYLKIFISVKKA